jgi:hypothetical protein
LSCVWPISADPISGESQIHKGRNNLRFILSTIVIGPLYSTAVFAADAKAGAAVYDVGRSDDEMKKIITEGKGKMRPVSAVMGAATDNVVAYVRSLKK